MPRNWGFLAKNETLNESIHGVYPAKLEETFVIDDESVTVRPAKPVDVRRIQEHFYNLDKNDVASRFFHEKTRFVSDEIGKVSQIDYIKDLTMVAIVGEFGFGKIIAVGEYLLDPGKNMAEVAFSVSSDYKGKGLGRILIKKLSETARENGIRGTVCIHISGQPGHDKAV